jgi:hypothetical protein
VLGIEGAGLPLAVDLEFTDSTGGEDGIDKPNKAGV